MVIGGLRTAASPARMSTTHTRGGGGGGGDTTIRSALDLTTENKSSKDYVAIRGSEPTRCYPRERAEKVTNLPLIDWAGSKARAGAHTSKRSREPPTETLAKAILYHF